MTSNRSADTDAQTSKSSLAEPQLYWNEQGQPVSEKYDDVYFNSENGMAESRYVFIDSNNIPAVWETHKGTHTIVETGFGSGLNFLLTWYLWRQHCKENSEQTPKHLHFISVEKYPLNKQDLEKILALWPDLAPELRPDLKSICDKLLAHYPLQIDGFHSLQFKDENLTLTLIFNDVNIALPQLNGPVDAWYLDGFTPAKNPDMWSTELFRNMSRLSRKNTTVATFAAATTVRRGLQGAGFKVKRKSGFGKKREMLTAQFEQNQGPLKPNNNQLKPWLIPPTTRIETSFDANVAIIGAGLAGANTAYALARRGIKSDVFDHNGIAQQASGNPQGALYSKLAAGEATHTDIYVQGYLQALRGLSEQLEAGNGWQSTGLLQLAASEKEQLRQKKFIENTRYPKQLVQHLDAQQASNEAGVTLKYPGLFFPSAGWVSPAVLCQALLTHALISFQQAEVVDVKNTSLEHPDDKAKTWLLTYADGSRKYYQTVVFASAYQTQKLINDRAYLPIKSIRGQLTYIPTTDDKHGDFAATSLKTVLCAKGYIAPANEGLFCLGATYNLNEFSEQLNSKDHQQNLQHLSDFGDEFSPLAKHCEALNAQQQLTGRVGFRCTTPDYLPMAGPVINEQQFEQDFSSLRKNATRLPYKNAPMLSGLYMNIGHGSRGLSSASLCAELIAAYVCNENFPMAIEHAEALHPARFLIREMIRKKR